MNTYARLGDSYRRDAQPMEVTPCSAAEACRPGKAAKAQAVVPSLVAAESSLEGKAAELFAEKLTGKKNALKKARKATRKDRSSRGEGAGTHRAQRR